jgi:hypothetical protein
MPTVDLEYGEKRVEANEYAVLTAMFMLIDEAKRLPLAPQQRDEIESLEKWWIHRARGGPLFILRVDEMLSQAQCRPESFRQFIQLGRLKAEKCGEWLTADYVNRLVSAINWKPNTCRVAALLKVFGQLSEVVAAT